MKSPAGSDIDRYIAAASAEVRPLLQRIRETIASAAPQAEEIVSYRMPAFRMHGILLYFGAFKNHIGLFPPVSGDEKIERAIAPYAGPKGNLQFPLAKPVPYALIGRIAALRVRQDRARAAYSRKSR